MKDDVRDVDCNACLKGVFQSHLGGEPEELATQAQRFLQFWNSQPLTLFDGPKDIKALDELSRALVSFERFASGSLSHSARKRLEIYLTWGPSREDQDLLQFYDKNNGRHPQLFDELVAHASEMRRAVDATRRDIEGSNRTRRSLALIDVDRIQVVNLAVILWQKRKTTQIPGRDIKPTNPFARFLGDIFQCLGIESSPEKAYRSWFNQHR